VTTEHERPRSSAADLVDVLRPTDDAAGERRDEILDTASRLFAETGMRTSLQDIADACGIRPGSLYHHFESKEDIVGQLIERYHDELDRVAARATEELGVNDAANVLDLIAALGTAVARTGARHAAAVQFTFYEPPAGSDAKLVQLAQRPITSITGAMKAALAAARSRKLIRPGIDLELLADRMCTSVLVVGTGLFQDQPVDRVAAVLMDIFLGGLAVEPTSDAELDRSDAMRALGQIVATWDEPDDASDDRGAHIRAVARTEFGRRGYEVTTVREIAAAAEVSTGAVYRVIGSKEELLVSITSAFAQKVMMGWSSVLTSESSAVEKIDALVWLHINVLDRYLDEFKVQLAWLRQSPPETSMFGWSFQTASRGLRSLVTDGVRSGELRRLNASAELVARCILALSWMTESSARSAGNRAALALARDCVIRGASKR